MPPPEYRDMNEDVVLWSATGEHDDHNVEVCAEPVQILASWLTDTKVIRTSTGDVKTISGQLVVYEEVPLKSKVWLGTLENWYGSGSGDRPDEEICEVDSAVTSDDLKGRNTSFKYNLVKYSGRFSSG